MLIRFSFKNFKSFKNENCLDMEATSLKEHEYNIAKTENGDYIKIAAIYGANASGKTNVLQAFSYMKKKVLVSDDSRINNNLSEENIFTFMINNKPISLEVEILAENNKIYKYGFEVLNNAIISEWLYEKRVNKFYEIFDRTNNNIEVKDNKKKNIYIFLLFLKLFLFHLHFLFFPLQLALIYFRMLDIIFLFHFLQIIDFDNLLLYYMLLYHFCHVYVSLYYLQYYYEKSIQMNN